MRKMIPDNIYYMLQYFDRSLDSLLNNLSLRLSKQKSAEEAYLFGPLALLHSYRDKYLP